MRRALPALFLAAVVATGAAGCGSDDDGLATDGSPTTPATPATPSSPETPTSPPSPPASDKQSGAEVVELVTETAVGGEVGSAAVLSGGSDEASEFVGQFGGAMPERLRRLVEATEVPDGMLAYGAVVSVGCDVPDDVRVTDGTDGAEGLVVQAVPVAAPQQECLAAMTTVAVLLVPADAV